MTGPFVEGVTATQVGRNAQGAPQVLVEGVTVEQAAQGFERFSRILREGDEA